LQETHRFDLQEGRLVFSCWKIIAEEVKHPNNSYLPSIMSSVLGRRIPYPDGLTLNEWYTASHGRDRWKAVNSSLVFATSCLLLFDAMDVVGRSGEAARLSGVEFSQSFPGIRGSQYKVEGVLLRALKSLNSNKRGNKDHPSLGNTRKPSKESQPNSPWKMRRFGLAKSQAHDFDAEAHAIHELSDRSYFFYSPSLQDTNKQEALEVQALTLEPKSGHRESPVVVCDFTALYPSLVIAYNLCYSTCGGKLQYHSTRKEMRMKGATFGMIGPVFYPESKTATIFKHHIKSINHSNGQEKRKNRAYIVPSGTVFVGEAVVKGVLPQVLDEILSTRAMLKQAAKQYKLHAENVPSSVLRQLEARQLALKYVANVTYGYTSATFSGRCAMPLLADSIVECGRRTLTNAINVANKWGTRGKWIGAEVIYGDTDSVFVHLPGRSVQEAFQFGEEFCAAVTAENPPPVQLKLEKVRIDNKSE
jgi:DNA polymerase family B